jgi:signal transduction histidine kinase
MGLRGRFTLWFALAALVPIALAALVTRHVVSASLRADYRTTLAAAERAAREELDALAAETAATVAALASREHPDVRGLLFELELAGGGLSAEARRALRQRDAGIMTGVGLDLLFLVDDRGTILAAPHFRAAVDETDDRLRALAAARGGAPFFAREPMLTDGRTRRALVAAAALAVSEGERAITVVGGREIPVALLDRVRRDARVDARLVDAGGEVLLAAESGALAGPPTFRVPLASADGEPLAFLEVTVSDAELRALLRRVSVAALALACAASLASALLGVAVARGMTRDLDELVAGVEAAARGDLEHRVAARRDDEIGVVAAAVNEMMRELVAANQRLAVAQRIAAWQEIARRLAHEIKNPLTPIQMSVETMRRTWAKQHPSFEEIFDESTATILDEVGRLKRTVSEFSRFARLPKPVLQPCELNELVAAQTALYRGSCAIDEQLAPDLAPVLADRDQLAQVVLNLLENARDAIAGRADGRIRVETRVVDGQVALAVTDNGPGISAEAREQLFTPYFTTKHASGGTGLGLAIAHRIVSDHGGQIAIGDAGGEGARFEVRLPRC